MRELDDVYRVALFGHRTFDRYDLLATYLMKLVEKLIKEKKYIEIYIGRNGEFDIYAAAIVKKAQRLYGGENNELILVLPYDNKNIEYYEQYYDDVRIFEMPNLHPKVAITKRNRSMVEICDLIICYVERKEGGAYQAVRYAKKLDKDIINLAEYTEEL